jgi:heat shock protein HslJ
MMLGMRLRTAGRGIVFACTLLAVLACEGSVNAQADSPGTLIGTTWLAENIEQNGATEGVQSTLEFPEEGKVAGSGGCNRFQGSLTADREHLFGMLATTRKMCPPPQMEQETRFLQALGKATRLERKDSVMLVYGEGSEPLLKLSLMPQD